MRVLVVEDEPDLAKALCQALDEEGYAVDLARDGDTGLQKGQAWEYDALILDLLLPGRDGWSLLQELRRSKTVPVLVLTARDSAVSGKRDAS